jgi:hypothetical protein
VGIFSYTSSGGQILQNTVEDTLADSISQASGSNSIRVRGNRILNSGDDGVSNNSYVGDPGTVHDMTVQGNTILNNVWGSGLEVSGGNSITCSSSYVICALPREDFCNTQSVANVTVSGNTLVDNGPNQGSAIIRATLRPGTRCWLPQPIPHL